MARKDRRPDAAKNKFEQPKKEKKMGNLDDYARLYNNMTGRDLDKMPREMRAAQAGATSSGRPNAPFAGTDWATGMSAPGSDEDRELDAARDKVKKYLTTDIRPTSIDDVVGNETARAELLDALLSPTRVAIVTAMAQASGLMKSGWKVSCTAAATGCLSALMNCISTSLKMGHDLT